MSLWPTKRNAPNPPAVIVVGSLALVNGNAYLFTISVCGFELQAVESELRTLGLKNIHLDLNKHEIKIGVIGAFDRVCEIREQVRQRCSELEFEERWLGGVDVENILIHGCDYTETQRIITIDELYKKSAWCPDWKFYTDEGDVHCISHIVSTLGGYIIQDDQYRHWSVPRLHIVWKEL